MSGPVLVLDAEGIPLMPMSAAHARRLLKHGKATRIHHHVFTVIKLAKPIPQPALRPILIGIAIHRTTAELWIVAEGVRKPIPLLALLIDLRTDLTHRLRRRAAHRRRRRARQRYHAPPRHGQPFKLKRPSLHRSRWGTEYRKQRPQRVHHRLRKHTAPPTIEWRAAAIMRVIGALTKFIPITHISLLSPVAATAKNQEALSPAERRQHMIAAYGQQQADGRRIPVCAYCGTDQGVIEVEHLFPRDRGGSDAWGNLVLACRTCNRLKQNRTPAEAGMPLLHQTGNSMLVPQLTRPYRHQTAHALIRRCAATKWDLWWHHSTDEANPLVASILYETLLEMRTAPAHMVVKPIARSRKQVFTARNYPRTDVPPAQFTQTHQTLKRRVRVNYGLAITRLLNKRRVRVVSTDRSLHPDEHFIRIGTLCEAKRAGKLIKGLVAAVHSSGRLTLTRPSAATPAGIIWERIVVSPGSFIRVRATAPIIFFAIPEST
jgi:5-methylcytosine-specific restriction endonuclease McrA